jgi:monofunctional biosynthetic peptidoglycan transglycosylase
MSAGLAQPGAGHAAGAPFFSGPVHRTKGKPSGRDAGDVEERAHDRGQGPPDADATGQPVSHAAETAGDEPTTQRRVEADPTPPVLILPRAAGGGAGAVVVPAVVVAEAALSPAVEVIEPLVAPIESPQVETLSVETPPIRHAVLTVHERVVTAQTFEPMLIAEAPPAEPAAAAALPVLLTPAVSCVPEPPQERERIEPAPPPIIERGLDASPSQSDGVGLEDVRPSGSDTVTQRGLESVSAGAAGATTARESNGVGPGGSDTATDIWRTEPPSIRPRREALQPSGEALRLPRITLRGVLTFASVGLAALVGLLLALVVLYRWVDPPASTLILGQRLAGTPITQRWVPLERISPNLITAVVLSEDSAFCRHRGVDWGELKEAIESANDGIARGGSTISMQVVKNLFLWPSRNYVRKALEIPLTYVIEAAWSKQRILEIYLNIAEWGPGIFGAEAAARYHFRKPASTLNPREAALLAVSLPNPFDRQAGRPGPGTARLADNLLLRMRAGQGNTACVRARPAPG